MYMTAKTHGKTILCKCRGQATNNAKIVYLISLSTGLVRWGIAYTTWRMCPRSLRAMWCRIGGSPLLDMPITISLVWRSPGTVHKCPSKHIQTHKTCRRRPIFHPIKQCLVHICSPQPTESELLNKPKATTKGVVYVVKTNSGVNCLTSKINEYQHIIQTHKMKQHTPQA